MYKRGNKELQHWRTASAVHGFTCQNKEDTLYAIIDVLTDGEGSEDGEEPIDPMRLVDIVTTFEWSPTILPTIEEVFEEIKSNQNLSQD